MSRKKLTFMDIEGMAQDMVTAILEFLDRNEFKGYNVEVTDDNGIRIWQGNNLMFVWASSSCVPTAKAKRKNIETSKRG